MKLFNYTLMLAVLLSLTGCMPGMPLSDPFCVDCYYDAQSGKFLTAAQMEQAHPGSTKADAAGGVQ